MSQDGKSKGYGFVQFESEESANAAIENLNGSTVEGKQIYVATFVKKSDRVLPSPDAKYTNLYMKNLDLDVSEELLQEKFSEFGKITNLIITKDNNGNSKGFGFVNFDDPDDARRAMEAMNGTQLGSKVIYVARAQKRAERDQILRHQYEERRKEQIQKFKGSNVYVKNIEDGVDEDELQEHFSQCGTITSVKLMRDDKGISRGFGFVCFSTPEEANKAVITFHGYMFHRKPLYVAIAQRKEDRQAQLQLQYGQRITGLAGPSTAVIPAGYPPLYYTPPGVVPQMPPRQGLMYQPLGLRPGWRANGFVPPTRPAFQPVPLPMMPGTPRQHRHNRGRMNGPMFSQGGVQSLPFRPQARTGHAKYVPNGRQHEMNNGSAVPSSASNAAASQGGLEMLSSMLAAASPQHQKQMLGEYLYPLVQNLERDLAAKITGMLLEMDNSELLLLLESPESLAAKVDEAVQVLKLSKTKVTAGQEAIHSNNYLSAEVAVN
ncbi:RNA recognition motif domain [Macleaya cordata]|uniref:RNA recognition motif domain n=1 Tax=Macleaya cordata TaxID=56857 RepID=A0A200R5A8_MACCD|nr:RNA recognition motif domain [Macleaya cordata]